MRAWCALMLLMVVTGCLGQRPSAGSDPSPTESEPSALGYDWRRVTVRDDGNGTNVVLPLRLDNDSFEEARLRAFLQIVVPPGATPDSWAVHGFQRMGERWELMGFLTQGTGVSRVFEIGQPPAAALGVRPGLRTVPLILGVHEQAFGLIFLSLTDPNDSNRPRRYAADDDLVLVLSVRGSGPFDFLLRVVPEAEGMCWQPYVATEYLRSNFEAGLTCGDPPIEAEVAPTLTGLRTLPGFRFGIRFDFMTDSEGYSLVAGHARSRGTVDPLVDVRPFVGGGIETIRMPGAFSSGWTHDFLFFRDPSTAGNWSGRVGTYGAEKRFGGPLAGGPTYAYLTNYLLTPGPVWLCSGDGAGPSGSELHLTRATAARVDAEMLLYARVDLGAPLRELLGGVSAASRCAGVGPVLSLVPLWEKASGPGGAMPAS